MSAPARAFKYPAAPLHAIAATDTTESLASSILANSLSSNSAANAAAEELQWKQWTAKGKRADAAFNEKARVVAGVIGTLIAAAGVIWIITVA